MLAPTAPVLTEVTVMAPTALMLSALRRSPARTTEHADRLQAFCDALTASVGPRIQRANLIQTVSAEIAVYLGFVCQLRQTNVSEIPHVMVGVFVKNDGVSFPN